MAFGEEASGLKKCFTSFNAARYNVSKACRFFLDHISLTDSL
jgi:hypothetical protein